MVIQSLTFESFSVVLPKAMLCCSYVSSHYAIHHTFASIVSVCIFHTFLINTMYAYVYTFILYSSSMLGKIAFNQHYSQCMILNTLPAVALKYELAMKNIKLMQKKKFLILTHTHHTIFLC